MNVNQLFRAYVLMASYIRIYDLLLVILIVDDILYLPVSMVATHPRKIRGRRF